MSAWEGTILTWISQVVLMLMALVTLMVLHQKLSHLLGNLSCKMSPAMCLWLIRLQQIGCYKSLLQAAPRILIEVKYICSPNSFRSCNLTTKYKQVNLSKCVGHCEHWSFRKILGLAKQKKWLKWLFRSEFVREVSENVALFFNGFLFTDDIGE